MATFRTRTLPRRCLVSIAALSLALMPTALLFPGRATVAATMPPQRAALISIQPVNDKGVMQAFVGGFNAAAAQYHYAASRVILDEDPSTYVSTLQTVASAGYNLVIVTFPPMIQALSTVAPRFPNVHFLLLDAQIPKPLPNVQTLFFYENQSSFLSGALAAYMTRTHKVGFLGALVQDVINRYLVGFYEGVKYVNPHNTVCWSYVNALEDPALGKQFALTMYGQGIDVIHAATAGTEVGVYQASEQAHKYLIGADVDIRPFDPSYGLSASGPDFAQAAVLVMRQQANGTFRAGRQQYGLADGAVRLLPFNDKLVPQSVQRAVLHVQQLIVKGRIMVHTDTYLKQLKNCS